jgi:hypothetical protein
MTILYRVRTGITGPQGSPYLSTMYFDATGPSTAQGAADAVRAFWNSLILQIHTGTLIQVENTVTSIDDTDGSPTAVIAVTNNLVTATATGDPEAWATQGLLEWHTGIFVAGREVRGRNFIPAPTSNQSSGGAPAAAYLTALNAAASALIADGFSEFRIYSRKNATSKAVTSRNAWTKWAVLRSRRD